MKVNIENPDFCGTGLTPIRDLKPGTWFEWLEDVFILTSSKGEDHKIAFRFETSQLVTMSNNVKVSLIQPQNINIKVIENA